jgi:hypothetical protein
MTKNRTREGAGWLRSIAPRARRMLWGAALVACDPSPGASMDGVAIGAVDGGALDPQGSGDASRGDSSINQLGNPPGCPASEPTAGDPCTGPKGLDCAYRVSQCDPCGTHLACVGGQWARQSPQCPGPMPLCPAVLPAAGTPCSWACGTTWQCGYPACTGPMGLVATCSAGSWTVAPPPAQCNGG